MSRLPFTHTMFARLPNQCWLLSFAFCAPPTRPSPHCPGIQSCDPLLLPRAFLLYTSRQFGEPGPPRLGRHALRTDVVRFTPPFSISRPGANILPMGIWPVSKGCSCTLQYTTTKPIGPSTPPGSGSRDNGLTHFDYFDARAIYHSDWVYSDPYFASSFADLVSLFISSLEI